MIIQIEIDTDIVSDEELLRGSEFLKSLIREKPIDHQPEIESARISYGESDDYKYYGDNHMVIEAVQLKEDNWSDVYKFIHQYKGNMLSHALKPNGVLGIKTLEGIMTANQNDWIIRGVKGELYPCKPDIFEATYEKV